MGKLPLLMHGVFLHDPLPTISSIAPKEGMHRLLGIGIGTAKCEICTCDFDIGLNYYCCYYIPYIYSQKKKKKKDMQLKTPVHIGNKGHYLVHSSTL